MSKSCGLALLELTLFTPMSPFSMRCSYVCLSLMEPLRTLLLIERDPNLQMRFDKYFKRR